MNLSPGVTGITSGCLIQAGYFSKTKIQLELPSFTLHYSVSCNFKSAIHNPQPTIKAASIGMDCAPTSAAQALD
jgi:hypothetical protein